MEKGQKNNFVKNLDRHLEIHKKMLLISNIGQHFTFLIIDDILGIMSIKIFII